MDLLRSHVMNDDVLGLILDELHVKQLLRLESVCNQFMDCISSLDSSLGSALQRKNGLSVGLCFVNNKDCHSFINGDITKAIVLNNKYHLIESKHTLDSILEKCFNIKCLHLNSVSLSETIIDVIVSRCPQLKRLYLNGIHVNTELMNPMKRLLSQLSYLNLNLMPDFNIMPLLPQLTSLECIEFGKRVFGRPFRSFPMSITQYLPQNIRYLILRNISGDEKALDVLIQRCPQLEALDICDRSRNGWDHMFAMICTQLKLKRLAFTLVETPFSLGDRLSAHVFAKNISKLNHLRHLSVNLGFDFDTNAIQSMPSLESLSLNVKCCPKMFSKLMQVYPNVKRLALISIEINCECIENNGQHLTDNDYTACPHCVHKCMQFVSQLPRLKRLHIWSRTYHTFTVDSNDLKLFTQLNSMSLEMDVNVDQLFNFISHCVENMASKKYFKLVLRSDVMEPLLQRLNDMNVTTPKNIVIKNA